MPQRDIALSQKVNQLFIGVAHTYVVRDIDPLVFPNIIPEMLMRLSNPFLRHWVSMKGMNSILSDRIILEQENEAPVSSPNKSTQAQNLARFLG